MQVLMFKIYAKKFVHDFSFHMYFERLVLCPNLMNLSRVFNPPETGFNWAPA